MRVWLLVSAQTKCTQRKITSQHIDLGCLFRFLYYTVITDHTGYVYFAATVKYEMNGLQREREVKWSKEVEQEHVYKMIVKDAVFAFSCVCVSECLCNQQEFIHVRFVSYSSLPACFFFYNILHSVSQFNIKHRGFFFPFHNT